MEKGDFRRDRLAELGLERLQRPPQRGWSARSRQLSDRWHRFTAAGWEKTFFAVACAVAVVVAIIGVVALATRGGGGDNAPSALARRPNSTATKPAEGQNAPTAIVINVPDLPTLAPTEVPTPEPNNRRNCDEIRGTPYRSAAEREWYVASCSDTGGPANGQPTQPPSDHGGPQPTSPPPPTAPPGLTTAGAISLAVTWMTTSEAKSYTVDSGTCTAVQFSDHWSVNCTGRLSGCQSAACERSLAVCVFSDRSVVPTDQC